MFPPSGTLVRSSEGIKTNPEPAVPLLSQPLSVDTSCMFLCDVFHSLGAVKLRLLFLLYPTERADNTAHREHKAV